MCWSVEYERTGILDCPMTLEEFLTDIWANGFQDGQFGDVHEIGWHVFFVGDSEIGFYSLTTSHTGNTYVTVYENEQEFREDWATVENEEREFYSH